MPPVSQFATTQSNRNGYRRKVTNALFAVPSKVPTWRVRYGSADALPPPRRIRGCSKRLKAHTALGRSKQQAHLAGLRQGPVGARSRNGPDANNRVPQE